MGCPLHTESGFWGCAASQRIFFEFSSDAGFYGGLIDPLRGWRCKMDGKGLKIQQGLQLPKPRQLAPWMDKLICVSGDEFINSNDVIANNSRHDEMMTTLLMTMMMMMMMMIRSLIYCQQPQQHSLQQTDLHHRTLDVHLHTHTHTDTQTDRQSHIQSHIQAGLFPQFSTIWQNKTAVTLEDLCCEADLQQLWRPMFRLPAQSCQTAFQLVLGKRTWAMYSWSGCKRLICLGIEIRAHCDYFFKIVPSQISKVDMKNNTTHTPNVHCVAAGVSYI